MMNKKFLQWIIIGFSIFLAGCSPAQTAAIPTDIPEIDLVIAEGHIIPKEHWELAFSARGRVAEVMVEVGDTVEKDTPLARLGDDEQAAAALTAANLELVQAQQAYDDFIRTAGINSASAMENYQKSQVERSKAQVAWEAVIPNDIQDEIDTAQTDVQDKKKALDDAKENLDKYLDLKDDNPTRRQAEEDVRKAESDYNAALRKVEELQRSIDIPRSQLDAALAAESEARRTYELTRDSKVDPDINARLVARLENAKSQVAAAKAALDGFTLKAPDLALVTDNNLTVGEFASTDKPAIQLADISEWYIETSDLTELDVVKINIGQEVSVIPDALPDVTLTGTVERISPVFKSQSGDILYTVKIRLIDTDPSLKWGMTVQLSFTPEE